MSRSFILNFESFEGFTPRIPATLLCVAAVILGFEFVSRLTPEEYLVPGNSRQGEIAFMKHDVLSRFEAPQIILLGSSRIRRAVVPKLLDEKLDLPRNSTVNLGLASGRIFEALFLYEANREKLGAAKLVVLNIDEWQLSSGWHLGSLYEMHAPWRERLEFSGNLRSRLVLDGLFTLRHKLRLLPSALSHRFGHKSDRLQLSIDANNQVLPPLRKSREIDDMARYITEMDAFYSNFEISPVMQNHIEQLSIQIAAAGGKLVLMQLPNRAMYQKEVDRFKKDEYTQHIKALTELANRLGLPLFIYNQPSECGLNDANFEDYGHMNPAGAQIFTRFLAELIRKEKWLQKP